MTTEPRASGDTIVLTFTRAASSTWNGEARCKHAAVRNTTYLSAPTDYVRMVQAEHGLHHQVVGCNCPEDPPILNATVTYQPANGVAAGQQRYVPAQSASIARNFFFGGPLMCTRAGAYLVQAKTQLSRGLTQGAGGLGVILVSGQPVIEVPMVDQDGRATATIAGLLNLQPNQSLALGYENRSPNVQDVQTSSLTVSEVWVP